MSFDSPSLVLESFSFSPRVYGGEWQHVPAFAKMSRLKSLHLGPLARYDSNLSTAALGQLAAQDADGREVAFGEALRGKVVLVVNVASL